MAKSGVTFRYGSLPLGTFIVNPHFASLNAGCGLQRWKSNRAPRQRQSHRCCFCMVPGRHACCFGKAIA